MIYTMKRDEYPRVNTRKGCGKLMVSWNDLLSWWIFISFGMLTAKNYTYIYIYIYIWCVYTYQRVVQRQILANFRDLYSDGKNLYFDVLAPRVWICCWLVVSYSFFIFHKIWDNPSHWLIFFKMVKTTNQVGKKHLRYPACENHVKLRFLRVKHWDG
jgi:hypothetical protein